MSLDPWTLAFQLLNFAVLLLVLLRLLFRPVREIMERRATEIQAALDAANKARAEADRLAAGMDGERGRLQARRAEMLRALEAEIEEHRQRRLAAAATEAGEVVERGRALLAAERQRAEDELRGRAIRTAADFSAALVGQIADVDLHRALLRRLPDGLAGAAAELKGAAAAGQGVALRIESAFALNDEEAAGVRSAVERFLPVSDLATAIEPGLLAGVRLRGAERVYDFSLRGQLDDQAARLKSVS